MSHAPDLLACPRCREAVTPGEGAVRCPACHASYPRTEGVYRMLAPETRSSLSARTFTSQWRMRAEGRCEAGTLYGFTPEEHLERFLRGFGIGLADLAGKTVLDAGCGTALLAGELVRHAGEVVGVDFADSLGSDAPRPAPANLTLVQGDVLELPLASDRFDYVWCAGVIHTTPDPCRGFHELVRCLRLGGTLYAWVDRPVLNPIQRLHDLLPPLPPLALRWLSRLLAVPASLAVNLSRSERYRRPMSARRAAFLIHDHMASPHQHRFELADVAAWCEELGCAPPTDVSEDLGGLAVRTVKRRP